MDYLFCENDYVQASVSWDGYCYNCVVGFGGGPLLSGRWVESSETTKTLRALPMMITNPHLDDRMKRYGIHYFARKQGTRIVEWLLASVDEWNQLSPSITFSSVFQETFDVVFRENGGLFRLELPDNLQARKELQAALVRNIIAISKNDVDDLNWALRTITELVSDSMLPEDQFRVIESVFLDREYGGSERLSAIQVLLLNPTLLSKSPRISKEIEFLFDHETEKDAFDSVLMRAFVLGSPSRRAVRKLGPHIRQAYSDGDPDLQQAEAQLIRLGILSQRYAKKLKSRRAGNIDCMSDDAVIRQHAKWFVLEKDGSGNWISPASTLSRNVTVGDTILIKISSLEKPLRAEVKRFGLHAEVVVHVDLDDFKPSKEFETYGKDLSIGRWQDVHRGLWRWDAELKRQVLQAELKIVPNGRGWLILSFPYSGQIIVNIPDGDKTMLGSYHKSNEGVIEAFIKKNGAPVLVRLVSDGQGGFFRLREPGGSKDYGDDSWVAISDQPAQMVRFPWHKSLIQRYQRLEEQRGWRNTDNLADGIGSFRFQRTYGNHLTPRIENTERGDFNQSTSGSVYSPPSRSSTNIKLHVTAWPERFRETLNVLVPQLIKENVQFKFIDKWGEAKWTFTQIWLSSHEGTTFRVGKLIVIYPETPEEALRISRLVDQWLTEAGLSGGPIPVSDRIVPGTKSHAISYKYEGESNAFFQKPDGEVDPFEE